MSTAQTVHRPSYHAHDPHRDLRTSPCFAMLTVEDGGDLPAGSDCSWLQLMDAGSAALALSPDSTARSRPLMHG